MVTTIASYIFMVMLGTVIGIGIMSTLSINRINKADNEIARLKNQVNQLHKLGKSL